VDLTKKIIALTISGILVLLAATAAIFLYGGGDLTGDQGATDDDGINAIDTANDDSTDSTDDTDGTAAAHSSEDGVNATIELGTEVMVNGSTISTDPSSAVYLSTSSLGYSMVNIAMAGTYTISGTAEDLQVRIVAGTGDEIVLVLNGTSISCDSAPAILVQSAFDPLEANNSGVIIRLAEGTTNVIDGSHSDDNDAALSSNVSLLFDGDGALEITADMEGIETFVHLTINGGTLTITSDEDAINANEDGVSIITINGGTVYADGSGGTDGDGIDSNGYLIINGGVVYGLASGENSGIDSDLGTIINGGTVFATGIMNDGVSASSEQTVISFSFPSTLSEDTSVYVLDSSGDPVVAFRTLNRCSTFVYSSPELVSGTVFKVYVGGSISGTFDDYGLCTSFTVTGSGTLQTSSTRM
jgi:hypothetical protein